MADKREQILARLLAVCQGVSGVTLVRRNLMGVTEAELPAIVILDGSESARTSKQGPGRPAAGPVLLDMHPVIALMVSATAANLGTQLNTLRAAVLTAVLEDATLQALCGTNGGMAYEGCETGQARGQNATGDMLLQLHFTYPLKISDL